MNAKSQRRYGAKGFLNLEPLTGREISARFAVIEANSPGYRLSNIWKNLCGSAPLRLCAVFSGGRVVLVTETW
jgi:hypothetical protein